MECKGSKVLTMTEEESYLDSLFTEKEIFCLLNGLIRQEEYDEDYLQDIGCKLLRIYGDQRIQARHAVEEKSRKAIADLIGESG